MRHAPMLLRLPLLLLTVVGIGGMHALGHPGAEAHCASGQPQSVHIMDMRETAFPAATAVRRVSAELVAGAWAEQREACVALDPRAVCLAVLAAGLILLLMTLRAPRGRPRASSETGAALGLAGRGPPRVPRIGLNLADLSVLRN